MAKLVFDDAIGYVEVEVATVAGPVRATLDLYEAHNTYADFCREHGDNLKALAVAWCDWLTSKGLPGLSHNGGFKVADHIMGAVETLRGKGSGDGKPDSPVTTG